jgi:hypothetical protein
MEYTILSQSGFDLGESFVSKKLNLNKDQLKAICGILYLTSHFQGTLAIIKDPKGNTIDPEDYLKRHNGSKHFCILTYLGHDLTVKCESEDFINGLELICKILNRNFRKFIKSTDINKRRGLSLHQRNL